MEHDQITVVEGPKSTVSIALVPDIAGKGEWYEPPAPSKQTIQKMIQPQGPSAFPPAPRTNTSEPQTKAASPKADLGGKTYSFQVTLGAGSKPFEIRGSFTITPAQSADELSDR